MSVSRENHIENIKKELDEMIRNQCYMCKLYEYRCDKMKGYEMNVCHLRHLELVKVISSAR